MKKDRSTKVSNFKYLAVFVLASIALIAGIRLTTAAFTANSFLKAVATTNEADNLFSSNVLSGYTNEPSDSELDKSRKSISLGKKTDEGDIDFSFDIFNYLQDNKTIVNTKDITYSLTITATGVSEWSVNGTAVEGNTYTVNAITLRANRTDTQTYRISFPRSEVNKASFVVRAVANKPTGTNLWGLARKIVTSEESSVQPNTVTGHVQTTGGGNDISDQKAYSYVIEVSGKDADVTLSWDESMVEIEPYFRENNGIDQTTDLKSPITFHMEPGTKIVNFYRKDKAQPAQASDLGIEVK